MKDLTKAIGFIYKITSPNNKIYIGQTINHYNRKSKYKSNHFKGQIKLWNNCQKYDWNPADTFEIIEECLCGENKSFLNEREIYWINFYDSYNNGLNCTLGGHGNTGYVVSEETKQKLSNLNKGKKYSEEQKSKRKGQGLGRKHSEETIEKLKLINKGRKHSDEMKQKISELSKHKKNMLGKKHSEETKRKISEAKKGKKINAGKKIICINTNEIFNSLREAADVLNLNQGKISLVCNNKREHTKGFKFKFYET